MNWLVSSKSHLTGVSERVNGMEKNTHEGDFDPFLPLAVPYGSYMY